MLILHRRHHRVGDQRRLSRPCLSVAADILFAGVLDREAAFISCVWGPSPSGLTRLRDRSAMDALARLAGRSAKDAAAAQRSAASIQPTVDGPERGDHVVFTAVTGTASEALLFQHPVGRGMTINVFVDGFVPLTQSEPGDRNYARLFAAWLSAAIRTASTLQVSCQAMAWDIARSAVDTGAPSIAFGSRPVSPFADARATPPVHNTL